MAFPMLSEGIGPTQSAGQYSQLHHAELPPAVCELLGKRSIGCLKEQCTESRRCTA